MKANERWRIAVIEDDAPTAKDYTERLMRIWPDCRIEEYSDSESAMKAIMETDFDLVISDIKLGEGADRMAGIRIAKELDVKRTPLLVVSGLPQPDWHRDVFKALDAWEYLQKPIDPPEEFDTQVKRAMAFRAVTLQDAPYRSYEDALKVRVPDLVLDHRAADRVVWRGKRVKLPMCSYYIVELMASRPNEPVKYETLMEKLPTGKNKQNLRQRIQEIKERFEDADPDFDRIENKVMVGYYWRV